MSLDPLVYQQAMFAVLVVLAAVTLVNVFFFPRVRVPGETAAMPLLSVLLPARNEGKTLDRVLASLAAQDYPAFEVIILDDESTDDTAFVAAAWAARDARMRLVHGKSLPEGWAGKTFACHQLGAMARGDLLLFVDADTVHHPGSLRAAVAELETSRADLLTLLPHQIMESFWEKALLPLLHFVTFTFLPMPLVSITRSPSIGMANGQFLLFRKEVYRRIGGHESVRSALVEDVWLARQIKRHGYRLVIRDGGPVVSCRMYTSFLEIWQGFSKNLFAGFRYSMLSVILVAAFLFITSALPFLTASIFLVRNAIADPVFPYLVAQVALLLGMRLGTALRFKTPLWSSFLHPLAIVLLLGMLVNSCRWVLFSGGSRWKGRVYDLRRQTLA